MSLRACDVLCMCIQFVVPPCTDQERGTVAARFITKGKSDAVPAVRGDKTCRKVHSLHVLSLLPQQHYNLSFLSLVFLCVCVCVYARARARAYMTTNTHHEALAHELHKWWQN